VRSLNARNPAHTMQPLGPGGGFKAYSASYNHSGSINGGIRSIAWVCPETGSYRFYVSGAGGKSVTWYLSDGVTTVTPYAGSGALAVKTRFLTKGQIVNLVIGQSATATFPDGAVVSGGVGRVSTVDVNDNLVTDFAVATGGDYNIPGIPSSANGGLYIPGASYDYTYNGTPVTDSSSYGPGGLGFAPEYVGGPAHQYAPGVGGSCASSSYSWPMGGITIVRYG
jgi:hypothetical protein